MSVSRVVALCLLCALAAPALAAPPNTCAPINIPPSSVPEAERIAWANRAVWTVWDLAAGRWVGARLRTFPAIDPAGWLGAAPAGYVLLYNEPTTTPPTDGNGSRHLVLEAPVETWLMADTALGRPGAVRADTGQPDAHLGCVVSTQAWGWRPVAEVYAAIEGLQTAADHDCAATITTTTLAGRTDYDRICARSSGASAAVGIVGAALSNPPAQDAALWCAQWETGCASANEARAAALRANADAARAGTLDPATGQPAQVADWRLGWRVAVPAQ